MSAPITLHSDVAVKHAAVLKTRALEDKASEALRLEEEFGDHAKRVLLSIGKKQASQSVAIQLGERSEPVESFDAQRKEIQERLQRHGFAKAELAETLKHRKVHAATAAEAFRKAAQKHLTETEIEPARQDLAKAFDVLREALVNLMAAHHVTHGKHGNSDLWSFDGSYGPAVFFWTRFVRRKLSRTTPTRSSRRGCQIRSTASAQTICQALPKRKPPSWSGFSRS